MTEHRKYFGKKSPTLSISTDPGIETLQSVTDLSSRRELYSLCTLYNSLRVSSGSTL